MLRREAFWLRWLAWKTAQSVFLPSLHAVRDQVDGALEVLDRLETQTVHPRAPGGRILRSEPAAGRSRADDLTAIRGIGAATEARLRLAGIDSYADLASRTPEELARLARRSAKRIETERWVEQAWERASAGQEIPARRSSRQVRRRQSTSLDIGLEAS